MRLCVLLTLFVGTFAFPSIAIADEAVRDSPKPIPRLRAADTRIAAAIKEGLERSPSFRAIVNRISELDVIVYAESQPLLRGKLSGTMTWVTATKEFRYVRVSLNPDLNTWQLIASLGHELQHVVEVGEAPSIVSERTMSDYYRIAGQERYVQSDEWDTEAAQRAGEVVRREVTESYSNRVALSIQARRSEGGR